MWLVDQRSGFSGFQTHPRTSLNSCARSEMAGKRHIADLDPDYEHEDVEQHQAKRQRVLEQDAKQASIRRIESIVRTQFKVEIENKEAELNMVDQRLNQARSMIDRLRAVIMASYYSKLQQGPGKMQNSFLAPPPSIHPAVQKHIGKAPVSTVVKKEPAVTDTNSSTDRISPGVECSRVDKAASVKALKSSSMVESLTSAVPESKQDTSTRGSRFTTKKKIVVGNVSKFIPAGQREMNDKSTHKWMVYVRGLRDKPRIDSFVSKVWFFLHPSYRPNDLVEVSSPPFHLTRRGWGEFPVRVQLHFWDPRNKRVDVIHQLKLDKTCTGLQTLGAETVVEIEIHKDLTPAGSRTQSPLPCLTSVSSPLTVEAVVKHESSDRDRTENMSCSCKLGKTDCSKCMCRKVAQARAVSDSESSADVSSTHHDRVQHITIKEEPPDTYDERVCMKKSCTVSSSSSSESESKKVFMVPSVSGQLMNGEVASGETIDLPQAQTGKLLTACVPSSPVPQNTNQTSGTSPLVGTLVNAKPSSVSAGTSNPNMNLGNSGKRTVSLLQGQLIKSNLAASPIGLSGPDVSQTSGALSNTASISSTNASSSSPIVRTEIPGKILKNMQVQKIPTVSLSRDKRVSAGVSPGTGSIVTPTGVGSRSSGTASPVLLQVTPEGLKAVQQQKVSHTLSTATQSALGANLQITASTAGKLSSVVGTQPGTVRAKIVPMVTKGASPGMVSLLRKQSPLLIIPTSSASVPGQPSALRPPVSSSSPRMVSLLSNLTSGKVEGASSTSSNPSASSDSSKTQAVMLVSNGSNIIKQKPTPAAVGVVTGTTAGAGSSVQKISLLRQPEPSAKLACPSGASLNPNSLLTPTPTVASGQQGQTSGATQNLPSKVASPILLLPSQVKTLKSVGDAGRVIHPLTVSGGKTVLMKADALWYKSGQRSDSSDGKSDIILTASSAQASGAKTQICMPVISQQQSAQGQPSSENPKSQVMQRTAKSLPNQRTQPHSSAVSMGAELAKLKAAILARRHNSHAQLRPRTAKWFSRGVCSCVSVLPPVSEQQGEMQALTQNSDSSSGQWLQENGCDGACSSSDTEPEKKIMVWKTKKVRAAEDMLIQSETPVSKLSINDFPDMRSLMRAAVSRHPLIDPDADKYTSPYCAKSLDQWLSWKTGKQRSSEWMRAVSVRKYLQSHLGADLQFKGEQLWTTNHIMQWCRLHGLSPHGPGGHIISPAPSNTCVDDEEATPVQSLSSLSNADDLLTHFTFSSNGSGEDSDESDEIDIISDDFPKQVTVKQEKEPTEELEAETETLAPSSEAVFIQEISAKLGIKYQPTEIVPGVFGSVAEDMMFAAMLEFASDILHESVGVKFMSKSPSATLSAKHVYKAVSTFPAADFLTNKYCGVEQQNSPGKR